MGSTVHVNVQMSPDFEQVIKTMPQVKAALTKEASAISEQANALGSSFKTAKYHPDHTSPGVGGTTPKYGYEKAKDANRYGLVATVHPKNYAAMKDNMVNNTLLKAMG